MRKSTGLRNDSDSDSSAEQSRSKKIKCDDISNNNNNSVSSKKLSQRELEAELLKQHEERERLRHHEEIRKRLRLKTQSDSDNESKKKTDLLATRFDNDIYAAEEDDDDRSSNLRRQQKTSQHSRSLQNYVEERRKKQVTTKSIVPDVLSSSLSSSEDEDQMKSSEKTKKTQLLKVEEVYNSCSSDDDDDHRRARSRSPEDKVKRKTIHKRSTTISNKTELKSMILTRYRMEKWCHAPFFASVAKGAFVRINIGQNNGVPVYRICEIRDVVETAKVYDLGSTRTNKGLRLKFGDHERVFRLKFVSNREISDHEFNRWREALSKKGLSLPTLEVREKKMEEIERCKRYAYTDREITKIVQENSRFRKAPVNYAVTKTELMKDIELAQEEQNVEKEKELRGKLVEIEERASELDRKRTQNISALAEINRRNRRKTQQNIEEALMREAREQRNVIADPFTRSRCAPTLVSKAPQTKDDLIRELHLRREADEAAAKKKVAQQEEKRQKEKAKEIHFDVDAPMDKNYSSVPIRERGSFMNINEPTDELFASHNFELDVPIQLFQD